MILFLDTEFTDFQQPALISLGLVSECGRYAFYAERTDYSAAACSTFVRENVIPKLGQNLPLPGGRMDAAGLTAALGGWLAEVHALDTHLEDGGAVLVLHDFQTDFDLFTTALDGNLPAWVEGHNVAVRLGWVGSSAGADAHHALHDAKALRAAWLATRPANWME